MAEHHFVSESHLPDNEVDKFYLLDQSERSLYSSTEPQIQFYQPKPSKRDVVFCANKSETKDFELEDLIVPELSSGISRMIPSSGNLNESQPAIQLPKLEIEDKKNTESLEEESITMSPIIANEAQVAILPISACESDIDKSAPALVQGCLHLSPFGVKAIEAKIANPLICRKTTDFATFAEWSGVFDEMNRNQESDMAYQQLRSILRKDQLDEVKRLETKRSVHFGFPIVRTKYFSSDDEVESTTSTELLFSNEEDELQETDNQEVPQKENSDESCTKKVRIDDREFVPSFTFPNVISIPSLNMLRFTDEKDHNMTTITNGPPQKIDFEIDNNRIKHVHDIGNSIHGEELLAFKKKTDYHPESLEEPMLISFCQNDDRDYGKSSRETKNQEKPNLELISANHKNDQLSQNCILPDTNNQYTETKIQEKPLLKELVPTNHNNDRLSRNRMLPGINDQQTETNIQEKLPVGELGPANHRNDQLSRNRMLPDSNDQHTESNIQEKLPVGELGPANHSNDQLSRNRMLPDIKDQQTETKIQEKPHLEELIPANYNNHQLSRNRMLPDINDQHTETKMQKKPHLELCKTGCFNMLFMSTGEKQHSYTETQDCRLDPIHVKSQISNGKSSRDSKNEGIWDTEMQDYLETVKETGSRHFDSSFSTQEVSEALASERTVLLEMPLIQAEYAAPTNPVSAITKSTCKIPCSRADDHRPVYGVCASLFQLGEEILLEEVDNEPYIATDITMEKPWLDKDLLEFDDTSLYIDEVTQRLESPLLSPVKNSWAKEASIKETFYCDDIDEENFSSQISGITNELNYIETNESRVCEEIRRQSSHQDTVATNDIENQEQGAFHYQNKYSLEFLKTLERNANSLDGPELLEIAMHLVDSALRKTKNHKKLKSCPKKTKSNFKATEANITPAFTWKKFSCAENQRAALNSYKENNFDNDGFENGSPNSTQLYYNKTCTRPLRLGLSKRSHTHSLHPYAVRSRFSGTSQNKNQEVPDYNYSQ